MAITGGVLITNETCKMDHDLLQYLFITLKALIDTSGALDAVECMLSAQVIRG